MSNFSIIRIVFVFLLVLLIGCRDKSNQVKLLKGTDEFEGNKLYMDMACNACHTINGSLKLGPTLQGQYGKEVLHTDGSIMIVDDGYIIESIKDPLKHIVEGYTPIMPNYSPILNDADIHNIIQYIKTLK